MINLKILQMKPNHNQSFWSFLLILQAFILCLIVKKPEVTQRPLISIPTYSVSLLDTTQTIKQDGTLFYR